MKTKTDNVTQFTYAFRDDFGIELQADEASDAFARLSKFFDLLDQWSREDRQKMKTNGDKNYAA